MVVNSDSEKGIQVENYDAEYAYRALFPVGLGRFTLRKRNTAVTYDRRAYVGKVVTVGKTSETNNFLLILMRLR